MIAHFPRVVTVLGGVCAILVVGEVMIGEKSTPLSHDPELRAMQRAPDFASDFSYASFCVKRDCLSDDSKLLDYNIERSDAAGEKSTSRTMDH